MKTNLKLGFILTIAFVLVTTTLVTITSGEISEQNHDLISRTETTNTYCSNGVCNLILYSGIINYWDGTEYVPIDLILKPAGRSGYVYELTSAPYHAYFKNNTNTAEAVRFEKDNFFFAYDLSGGTIQYRGTPTQPDKIDTLGSGYPSNSQDTEIGVIDSKVNYVDAYSFTNVTYQLYNDMLKETFILDKPNSYTYKDYNYLEYTGNIKFNKTLQICANNECYIPSGIQDDFETSGRIEFKNSGGNTIFYLKEPIITDSAGNTTIGLYSVHGSNAQMNFWLRINLTWLKNAVYPVYIDPTIQLNTSLGDGHLYASDTYWNDAHDATQGQVDYTSTTAQVSAQNGGTATFYRAFIPINTSDISDTASISSGEMCIYVTYTFEGDNDAQAYLVVVGNTTQASTSSLTNNDFDNCGAVNNPKQFSNQKDITSISTSQYLCFALNSTGLSAINKNGFTMFGIREGHDVEDAQISGSNINQVTFTTSEGTNKPYINVTYVLQTSPTIQVQNTFVNCSTKHCFNVTVGVEDLNGGNDIIRSNISVSSGTCTHLSNTSSGNYFNVTYNCSGTAMTSTNIVIGFNDSVGNYNSTTQSANTYPNQLPSQPSLNNPSDAAKVTSINMTWTASTDVDGDTINYYVRVNGTQVCYTSGLNCSYAPANAYYDWNVTAFDGYQNGTESTLRHFTYDTRAPENITVGINDTSVKVNDIVLFYANWSDSLAGLNYSVFSWNHSGSWVNESAVALTLWSNITLSVNATKKPLISWIIYANDSIGNWNNTGIQTFTINNTAPSITTTLTTVTQNTSTTYIYDYNGTDVDDDTISWSDNTSLFNIDSGTGIITDTPTESETGAYSINITISDGTESNDDTFTYTITDTTPPTYTGLTNNGTTAKIGTSVNWSVTLAEGYQLGYYIFSYNTSGSWSNDSATVMSGTSHSANVTRNITATRSKSVCGMFYFNDSSGNINSTTTSCFNVVNTAPTIQVQNIFVNCSASHCFNVSAGVTDFDNSSDIKYSNISTSTGTCTHYSNTSLGNLFNVTYNCSGTAFTLATLSIGFTDDGGGYVQSTASANPYPDTAPTDPSVVNITSGILHVGITEYAVVNTGTDADGDGIYYYDKIYNLNDSRIVKDWTNDSGFAPTSVDAHDMLVIYGKSVTFYANSTGVANISFIVNNTKPTMPALSSPENLSIQPNNVVTLAWAASADADNDSVTYYVHISPDAVPTYNYTTNSTSYALTLTDGVTYNWYVLANDGDLTQNSSRDDIRQFSISSTAPDVAFALPTPTADARQYSNSFTINATIGHNSTNISFCVLVWNSTTNYTMTKLGTGTNVTCNYTAPTINGVSYTYEVRANTTGSVWGSSGTRTNLENTHPSIANQYPTNAATSSVTYSIINWTASDAENDTLTYYVYGNSTRNNTLVQLYTGNLTSYNWTPLDDGKYYWYVIAGDGYENTTSTTTYFEPKIVPVLSGELLPSTSGYTDTAITIYVNCTDTGSNISSVKVSIYDPNAVWMNYSMVPNTGDQYKKVYTPSTVGSYNFSFYCTDSYGISTSNESTGLTFSSSTRPVVSPGGGGGSDYGYDEEPTRGNVSFRLSPSGLIDIVTAPGKSKNVTVTVISESSAGVKHTIVVYDPCKVVKDIYSEGVDLASSAYFNIAPFETKKYIFDITTPLDFANDTCLTVLSFVDESGAEQVLTLRIINNPSLNIAIKMLQVLNYPIEFTPAATKTEFMTETSFLVIPASKSFTIPMIGLVIVIAIFVITRFLLFKYVLDFRNKKLKNMLNVSALTITFCLYLVMFANAIGISNFWDSIILRWLGIAMVAVTIVLLGFVFKVKPW